MKRSELKQIIREEVRFLCIEAKYKITKADSGFGDRFFRAARRGRST